MHEFPNPGVSVAGHRVGARRGLARGGRDVRVGVMAVLTCWCLPSFQARSRAVWCVRSGEAINLIIKSLEKMRNKSHGEAEAHAKIIPTLD